MEYELIRSNRKTLGLQVRGSHVIVRAPLRVSQACIDRFVKAHETWIARRMQKNAAAAARAASVQPLRPEQLRDLAARAKLEIPERVQYYAARLGVDYGRITIRAQRTRWGSCSAKGNLNFNCLLMLAPPEVADSVVVHELCHRREMNHSPRFYALVKSVFPEYDRCRAWLRENGSVLFSRLPAVEK